MNLPPDKVRLLRSYDNEKKWELICDQVSIVKKKNIFLFFVLLQKQATNVWYEDCKARIMFCSI